MYLFFKREDPPLPHPRRLTLGQFYSIQSGLFNPLMNQVYLDSCHTTKKAYLNVVLFIHFREINMRLLKDNIELFFKKDSNFKRPLKTDVIYAKLTKGFVPHYEWNGHRRRIPWKLLKKDQTVNKFPSAFFTTKTGLHQSLQQLHWYSPFPVSSFFPRCYQVSQALFICAILKLLKCV